MYTITIIKIEIIKANSDNSSNDSNNNDNYGDDDTSINNNIIRMLHPPAESVTLVEQYTNLELD